MSRGSTKITPSVVELATPTSAARMSAEIFLLQANEIGRKRIQRVDLLARACGDESPDQKAKSAKQTEERVPDVPGVVEITYGRGKRKGVWFFRYLCPLTGRKTCIRLGEVGVIPFIEMVALAKRYRDDIAAGRSPKSARMTLETFTRLYFAAWAEKHQRSSKCTLARLERYVLPLLGKKSLADIDHRDGETLIRTLRQGNDLMRFGVLSAASINRVLMAGRSAFRLAVDLGFIPDNPFKRIRQLKESPPSPKALDADELDRFLDVLQGEPELFILLVKFLLATAARISEILQLREDDIDYAKGEVRLRMTKSGEPDTLPLTTSVAVILDALKPLRRPGNPHLFAAMSGDGHMAAPYQWLRKVLAAAGLDRAGFHLFRKTVATHAMQLPGMDVLTVSRLLRHKSVHTLEAHYLATPKKRLIQAANDIGEVLLSRRERGAP